MMARRGGRTWDKKLIGRGGAIALVQVPERGALVPKRENEGENNYIVAQRRGVNRSLGKIPLHSVLENLA